MARLVRAFSFGGFAAIADNVVLNAGSGGDTVAADDVSGVKYQVVKLAVGADGAASLVANANPIPVSDAGGSVTVDNGGTFPVQATIAAAATNIAKAEDAASADGDVGVPALAVRKATPANTSGTDGDYEFLQMSAGRVWASATIDAALPAGTNAIGKLAANSGVDIGDVDVTTVGTITPGTAATSLGKAEDAAHTSGDVGVMMLGVRRDADNTPVSADGDYHTPLFDANGYLKVNIKAGAGSGGTALADAATFTRGTTSETPVAGVVETSAPTLTNGQAGALSLTTGGAVRVAVASGGIAGVIEDAASSGGEEGVLAMAVRRDTAASSSGTDGDFSTLNTDANGRLHVITGPSTGTIEVVGDVAHDAVAAGNPILAGAYASAAAPSDVSADADAVRLWALRSGALAVQPTLGGVLATAGNGASGMGVQRVTLASDSTGNIATIGTSVTPGTAAANLGKAEDAAHSSGDVGVMMLTVRQNTAAALSGTDGDYQPAITDTNGRLHTIEANSASIQTSVQLIDDTIIADDAAFTVGTTKVNVIGHLADETATDSVDEGDVGASRMTLDRKLIVAPYAHAAAGGATPYQNLDVDESEDDVKTSAGKVFWIHAINLANAKRYLKFYNATAANVTVGSTTPVLTLPLPTMGDTNGAGFTINFGDIGVQFDTAICIAATTGFAVADTGAPGTNDVIVNLGYL